MQSQDQRPDLMPTAKIEDTADQPLRGRKAGGPRTPEGKQRSKYNALKHGIFSKIVLLKDESRSEFNSVLSGLRNDLRPEGELEQHLVENLAALIWRHRRLLLAESAEIRKNMEFFKSDQRDREREEAERIARSSDPLNNHGLIGEIHNPDVLERCQQLLFQLRKRIKEHGFNLEYDKQIGTARSTWGRLRCRRPQGSIS